MIGSLTAKLAALLLAFTCVGSAWANPVAKVGTTEYETIDEAIAAWGPGKTLTLLANVEHNETVIVEVNATKSTSNWTLDLGDYTWTANGCNAFQLYAAGGTVMNQNYGLKVYANENGGITAAGKYCIECKYDNSKIRYRPRLEIHGGTYTGTEIIYYYRGTSTNSNIENGCSTHIFKSNDDSEPVFNGNFGLYKCPVTIHAGYFNGTNFNTYPVGSTADTTINGGTFKNLDALPSANNNKGIIFGSGVVIYVDEEGKFHAVQSSAVPSEYEAKTPKFSNIGIWPAYYRFEKYTQDFYWADADVAIANFSSLTTKTVTLSAGVTATQPVTVPSGTYTIDATAEGAAYNGTVTINGTSAKFVFLGNGDYTVTSGRQSYYVKKVTDGSTSTYSLIQQPAARIGDYYYKTLDEAVAAYQKGDTIYVINYQESMTAPEGWLFKAVGDDMTLVMAVAQIGDVQYVTFEEAIDAADAGNVNEITILNGATESPHADWKISDGKLIRKIYVAQIGETKYETFAAALDAVKDGDTIQLLAHIDATASSLYTENRIPISKSLTIDGHGHSITVAQRGFGVGMNMNDSSKIDVTFKDVTINNSSDGARCIDTRGNLNSLTLDHVTLDTNGGSGYTQPLTIGGNQDDAATVSIVNESKIQTNDEGTAYYAIITFNPVNMTIDHSTIKGWACIYAKGSDGCAGSAGSLFTIKNSELVSNNGYSGVSNAFAMLMAEDDNVTFNITNTEIDIDATGDQYQAIIATASGKTGVTANLSDGNTVTLQGENAKFAFNGGQPIVSGGTFNKAVDEKYCAPGYIPTSTTKDGVTTYGVKEGSYVARNMTTDVGYESLDEALKAAQSGETVKLLQTVSLTERLFVNAGANPSFGTNNRYATTAEDKAVTLDLNGKNITSESNIALAGGSLTITGSGTISTTTSGLAPIEIYGRGDLEKKRKLTIGSGVTLNSTNSSYGLNVFGSNSDAKNLIDVTVDGTVNGTIFVLGNLKNAKNEINIVVNGTVKAPAGEGDNVNVGIALNGNANVTVNNGATVSGDSGIEVRAGTLTVNGGTITGTAETYSYKANGSGSSTKGAAIAVAQHTTVLGTAVTLNGGTPNGVKTIGVTDVNGNMDKVSVLATQAYTADSSIPEDYKWVAVENTDPVKYKLVKKDYVAQISETKYETFAAALDAVKDGETITVLNVAGNESNLIEFDRKSDIAFTITGTAPNYGLPIVTFVDKDASGGKITVTIRNATLKTAELDARQNATINVVDSTIKGKGSNDIVKSYFNGAINIGGASKVYTMQLTTTGYITISDNAEVTATWQANVLCNGLLTVAPGAKLNTAALQLTGNAYLGRDNTDTDRVGKPAALVVDGATLNVGWNAYSSDGADYNYNSSVCGINIGTVDGKSAVLDIKNASTVVLAQNSGNGTYDKKVTFGAGATVNVTGGSTLTVRDRGSNGVTLTNGGKIALDVTSSVVTPGFASTSGSIAIDSTGLTQPVKVIDYTGAGTMAIADYGTVTVTSGETYAEANDLWVRRLDVAQIGTTKYASLAEAILAAQDGDTIEILDGTWGADAVGVFDEPGKYTNAQAVRAKSLTIQAAKGAKPKFTADVKLGYEDSKTANATMTVKGLAFENAKLSLVNYVQATVEDCTFTGSGANAALFVGDSCDKKHLTSGDYPADQVTIKDCTFNGTAAGAAAIRVRNGGNVTVTGNTVANSAHNGILLESNTAFDNTAVKTVTITGNTITEWNAGNVAEGGRGIRASLGGLAEGSTVTVKGNVFRKTTTGLDKPDFAKITGAGSAAVDISGNDWNNMLLSEVKDNGAVYTSDATTTTITSVITTRKEPVAQIGTTKYETLKDANDASQSGDTIELLKDVEIEDRILLKSGVTLDGKNKTISPANSAPFTPDANHDGYNMLEVGDGVTDVTIKNVTITSYNATEKREMAPRHLIAVSGQATVRDVTLHQYTVGFVKNASSGKRGADALQTNGDCTIAGALSVAVGTEVWSPISLNNTKAANTVRFADGATLTITEDLRPEPQQATIRTHGFTTTEVIGADKIGYVAVFGAAKGTTCNQSGYEPADSTKVGNTTRPGTLYNYKATVGADEAYYTTFALAATVVDTTGTVENFKAPAGDDVYALTLANTPLKVIKNGFEPNLTVPKGYELLVTTAEGGVTTYTIGEGVATITTGGVTRYYASLQNAVDAAVADDTVNLIKDATAERTTISKSITVDLGGNTLTGRLTVDDGEVTVQNGTVVGRFDAYDAATVTLAKTATVTGQVVVWGTGTYGETGCKTPTMNVYGTVSNTGDSAIIFNGTDTSGAILNIYADATVTSTDNIAIYQPSGNVNVNGGTITGATGIYTKAGALSISGGTISGTGTAAAYTHNGNGANATGDALVVENCGYPNGAPVVSITGGTFRSTNAKAVGSYAKDSTFPALTGFILPTGTALFSDDVSDGVPAGYELVPAGEDYDGLYKLASLTGILYVTGKDANGKNRGVMMDVTWLQENRFIKDVVPTQAELDGMQAALSESGKNGLPYWQSYVLGVDPNGTYPLTIAKGVSSGENYIITGKFAGGKEGFNTANDTIFRVKPSKNATMTVEFTLVQRGAFDADANDWTWSEVASATQTASSTNTAPQFTVPMDKVANKVLAISVTIMVDDKK